MMVATSATWIVYQPLIVGLGAVVLATIGNTLLEWFRQRLANKHRATALRRALLEELRVLQESIESNFERTSNLSEGGSFLIPVTEGYRVYDSSIAEIGILEPAEVSAVTKAYAYLHAQRETFSVMGTFNRSEAGVLHAVVSSTYAQILSGHNRQLNDIVGAAIKQMERRTS